jgi:hypothetical protein
MPYVFYLIKDDLVKVVQDSSLFRKVLDAINKTFIALIPKK